MKCPLVLKAEVTEIASKLGLKVVVTDNNVTKLAQQFGIIAKETKRSLNSLSDKEN